MYTIITIIFFLWVIYVCVRNLNIICPGCGSTDIHCLMDSQHYICQTCRKFYTSKEIFEKKKK